MSESLWSADHRGDRVVEVSVERRAVARAARNRRWGAALALLGALGVLAGGLLLTMNVYDATTSCGTVLSHPNWGSNEGCRDAIRGVAFGGWGALLLSSATLGVAAQLRWGPGWSRSRYLDARAGDVS